MSTYDVRFWKILKRTGRRPWHVRWTVGGRVRSQSFATKGLAERFRAELLAAASRGEPFDEISGLPGSKLRQLRQVSWYTLARDYVAVKWPNAAPKTRAGIADALATVTPALAGGGRGRPDPQTLRTALAGWAFNPPRWTAQPPPQIAAALRWVERASVLVGELAKPEVTRRALDALAVRMDGRPAAAHTVSRKRRVLYNALRYAMRERGLLAAHPIDAVDWTAPAVAEVIDRRVVASPSQVRDLLDAVGAVGRRQGRRLVAFFACLYYAGLRPSEAVALRADDCLIPPSGWGRLTLSGSEPAPGKQWTDNGQTHQRRGLKHRPHKTTRVVPIPPELVGIMRGHISEFGTSDDGRLFRSERGNPLHPSTYWRVWSRARRTALSPARAASPLAARPYDLRHAAVPLWLNAGVPATEVADRAGHSVDVLLKVYAKCIDGQQQAINTRIETALTHTSDTQEKTAAA